MADLTGRCLCGRVKYSATGDPIRSGICHCRNCQRYTGSAFEPFLAFPTTSVVVTGELKSYEHDAASGRAVRRCFCPTCGSGVVNVVPMRGLTVILAGTLDDPSRFEPAFEIFCVTSMPWVGSGKTIKRFPGMPG